MKLMLDDVEYNCKPNYEEVKKINNRICNKQVDISIEQLAYEATKGKSFVPALLSKKVDGKVRRSINSWSSQEVVCLDFDDGMTLEEAVVEFKDTAAFIYTTFNHTEEKHKFRVVFVLDEILTEYVQFNELIKVLLIKYPMADKSCSDGSRMFYGGTSYIELDFSNKLILSDYIDTRTHRCQIDCARVDLDFSTLDTLIPKDIKGRKIPQGDKKQVNIRVSDTFDDEGYREFAHLNDAYDYLYKQDLNKFLLDSGLIDGSKKFNCIFHNDNSPSASIFVDPKSKNNIYKCHSDNCGFAGNIFRVTERLTKMNRVEVFKWLCEFYKIRIVESEWQKQQKEKYDHNIHILASDMLKHEQPEFYKKNKRYLSTLILMNMIAKQYIGTDTLRELEVDMFTASKTYIAKMAGELNELISNTYDELEYKKINSDVKEIGKRVDFFSYLGVVNKIHITEIPNELKKIAVSQRSKKAIQTGKERNFQNYYSIPEYGDELLTNANNKVIEFQKNNMTISAFGREMVMRSTNKEEADRAYPMLRNLELSGNRNEISEYIKSKFLSKIEENGGWATEKEIMEELIQESLQKSKGKYKGKNSNMKNIKKNLNELIEGYGLVRERLNNILKKKLKLEGKVSGYPFVIYRVEKLNT